MRAISIAWILSFTISTLTADTVTFKDGRLLTGAYLGGSSREIKLQVGDQIQTLNIEDITGIQFGAAPKQDRRDAAPTGASGVTLPAGTKLVIRMIDAVDSERNTVGQTFAASLDEPVLIDGQAVIPRGADVVVKLVDDKESGKLTGRTTLTLALMSLKVNGRMVDVNTETVSQESASRGARTAKVAGGAAALGTIIGAVAGGGKGAAIGLGAGLGAGAGVEMVTKGERVRIPSETRLTFALENSIRL